MENEFSFKYAFCCPGSMILQPSLSFVVIRSFVRIPRSLHSPCLDDHNGPTRAHHMELFRLFFSFDDQTRLGKDLTLLSSLFAPLNQTAPQRPTDSMGLTNRAILTDRCTIYPILLSRSCLGPSGRLAHARPTI